MGKGRYSIVFNSPTGNTKKLADTIYAVLPKETVTISECLKRETYTPRCSILGFGRTREMRISPP